jgi:hypothetical protein
VIIKRYVINAVKRRISSDVGRVIINVCARIRSRVVGLRNKRNLNKRTPSEVYTHWLRTILCISKVCRILGATIELLCFPSKLRCRNGFNENVFRLRRMCFFLFLIVALACIAASKRSIKFP